MLKHPVLRFFFVICIPFFGIRFFFIVPFSSTLLAKANIPSSSKTQSSEEKIEQFYYAKAMKLIEKKKFHRAEDFLQKVLKEDSLFREPSGKSAWYQLGRVSEYRNAKAAAIAVLEKGRKILQKSDILDLYLNYQLVRLYLENGIQERETLATRLAYDVFKKISPVQQPDLWERIYHETAFLLNQDERHQLKLLQNQPDSRPGILVLRFFRREDPFPFTPQNEMLTMLFRRMAEARSRFYDPGTPRKFDDRGVTYTRLGPPSHVVADHSGTPGDIGYLLQPYEVWFYKNIAPDVYFTFIRKRGNSKYNLVDGPESILGSFYKGRRTFFNRENAGETVTALRDEIYTSLAPLHKTFRDRIYIMSTQFSAAEAAMLAKQQFKQDDRNYREQLDHKLPAIIYPGREHLKTLPMDVSWAHFRHNKSQTRLEIYYAIPYAALSFEASTKGYFSELKGKIGIFDEHQQLVAVDSISQSAFAPSSQETQRGAFISQWNLGVSPGSYEIVFRMQNSLGGGEALTVAEIHSPGFSSQNLELSDIQLSPYITETNEKNEFTKHNTLVTPLPAKRIEKDQLLYIYYEVYNLTTDQDGKSRYRIDYRLRMEDENIAARKTEGISVEKEVDQESITISENRAAMGANQAEYLALDLSTFRTGKAELEIQVTDLASGLQSTSNVILTLLDSKKSKDKSVLSSF
jgi:GWxTD domain-containing protein